jgi:putative membrane protein
VNDITTLAQVVTESGTTTTNLFFLHLTAAVVYSVLGIVILLVTLYGMVKFSPMPLKKEIEEDQNVAVGIVIGSVLLGISIIIAAAIAG